MTPSTVLEGAPVDLRAQARRSFLLVFCCTLTGALAQLFIKQGAGQLGAHVTLADVAHHPALFIWFAWGMLMNPKLFFGYMLYGVNLFLMALALKGRELSRLYPIIALTYVWVTFISLFAVPDEHMNFFKWVGVIFIVSGVSVLGLKK